MFSLESDVMTAFWQMTAKLSLFISESQIAYQTEQLLEKKFFDSKFSLVSDKMTACEQLTD